MKHVWDTIFISLIHSITVTKRSAPVVCKPRKPGRQQIHFLRKVSGIWLWHNGDNSDGLWERVVFSKYKVEAEGWIIMLPVHTHPKIEGGILKFCVIWTEDSFHARRQNNSLLNRRWTSICWVPGFVQDLAFPEVKFKTVKAFGLCPFCCPRFRDEATQFLQLFKLLEGVYEPRSFEDCRVWTAMVFGIFLYTVKPFQDLLAD